LITIRNTLVIPTGVSGMYREKCARVCPQDTSNSGLYKEDVAAVSERLDELREEILKLERELNKFGYDPRIGIESRKVSELKELIERAGSEREKVKEMLAKLVETQEKLYKELYRSAGLKELNVDTETPEKNLVKIKKWLLGEGESPMPSGVTKFKQALEEIARALQTCRESREGEILSTLRRIYKRDYDRYRMVRYVLETCAELGGLDGEVGDLTAHSLESAVRLLNECADKVGVPQLVTRLRAVGARN